MSAAGVLHVDGHDVAVSSLDRVLWPATGTTKADLLAYYARVAPALLAHVREHPVTLHRFPEGVTGVHFYQTRTPPHPEWIRTQRMYTFRRSGKEVDSPVVDSEAALMWAANLSTIELHPYLGRVDDLDHPRYCVLDLDPGEPATIVDAAGVALAARALLDALALRSWPKLSGGKGLHVYVPLNVPHTYDETKSFARAVAATLVAAAPERVVDRIGTAARHGRVLVDWSQNDAGKSTVAPWSPRGSWSHPTVSRPIDWSDVERLADGDLGVVRVGFDDAIAQLERDGDGFAPVLTVEQRLPRDFSPEP